MFLYVIFTQSQYFVIFLQVNTPLTGSQNLSVKKKPKPDEIKMDEFDINGRVPCLLDHNHKAEDNSDDDKT